MNCEGGFSTSGPCGVSFIGGSGQPFAVVGTTSGSTPRLEGSAVNLLPANATHAALSLNYQTQVDVRAFTVTFTFTPNGWNCALVIQNSDNNPYFNGKDFSAGAGCEAGFFQSFSQAAPPNNVFAMEFDSSSPRNLGQPFDGSSVQIYRSGESPCIPNLGSDMPDWVYRAIPKIGTAPVELCSPPRQALSTTGQTYSATVMYDGSTVSLDLFNLTTGGNHLIRQWNNVNIPQIVGNDLAWIGITGATNQSVPNALLVRSFSYTEDTEVPPVEPPVEPPSGSQTVSISGTMTIGDKSGAVELTGTFTSS